jgi:hypothetical protein
MSTIQPVTAAQFPPEWLHDVRAAVLRDGQALRPHFMLPIIEAKSLALNRWMPLQVFTSTCHFATAGDRDQVLRWLTGEDTLPALPPTETSHSV